MQDDGFDKLIWKVVYKVEWKDFVPKVEGVGPVPAFIHGK